MPWGDPRRRLIGLLAAMLVASTLVVARLGQVQVLAADRYAAVGESQRVRTVRLPAQRGSIFDRHGRDLALSVRQSTVWANPRLVTDPLGAARALAPVLGADVEEVRGRLTRDAAFVYLARKVDDAVARRVEALRVPGVALLEEAERFLPAGTLAAPLLGRVGLDNEGLSGLEAQFDERLRGRPGRLVVERDPGGRDIPGGVREHVPSARGEDLVLTIDRSLQYEAERALAAEIVRSRARGGVVVVMHTRTGEVLAMANLQAGEDGVPQPAPANTALTVVHEPGSVNKMITVTGALEEGLTRPDERLTVPGTIKVADHVFKEHEPHPVQQWSVTDILANSSNVGAILLGQRLGKQRLDHYMRAFGFGRRTGLGFPGESPGILLDPRRWSGTTMGTVSIGQGIAVTALQMLAAYNTVANGGVHVAPKLVKATIDRAGRSHPTAPSPTRRVVSGRTAAQTTAMLREVVRVGTGKLAAVDGYAVAGKTGTARKPREGARGYEEGAYVSSFAGFVPAERPEVSAIVMLDEPTPIFGGLVAAPVFSEVARYALRQLRVPPPAPSQGTPGAAVPPVSPGGARPVGEVGEEEIAGGATTIAPSAPARRTP